MTFHAMPARQGVFHRRRQGVSQVQRSRDVGRRNNHDKSFRVLHHRRRITGIESRGFPPVLPCSFDGGRIIGVRHGQDGQILFGAFRCGIDERFLWFGGNDLGFLFLLGLTIPIGFFFGFTFSFRKFLELTFR
jgi:hypothetical protein